MSVESREEALSGIAEQHRRAKNGEKAYQGPGNEESPPAERIVKALFYSEHPNEYNPSDTLTADELEKAFKDLLDNLQDDNGVVPVGVLATEVRSLTHPMVVDPGAHDSKFLMPELTSPAPLSSTEIDKAADSIKGGA